MSIQGREKMIRTIIKIWILITIIACIYYRDDIQWGVFLQAIKNKPIQSIILLIIVINVLNSCGKDNETVSNTEFETIESTTEIMMETTVENVSGNNLIEDVCDEPVGSDAYLMWYMKKQNVKELNKLAEMADEYLQKVEEQNAEEEVNLKLVPNLSGYYYAHTLEKADYYYTGELQDNRPSGFGIMRNWIGGIEYCGNFKDGRFDGMGVLYGNGGRISYIGEFSHGRENGQGVSFMYADETKRDVLQTIVNSSNAVGMVFGGHKKGNIDGNVKFYLSGILRYEGEIKKGKLDGEGTLYFSNGKQIKYKGKWKNGKYDGKGTLYDKNGTIIYSGKWKKGDYDN